MNVLLSLFLLFFAYRLGKRCIPFGLSFFHHQKVTSLNYRKDRIPASFGGFLSVLLLFLSLILLGLSQVVPLFSLSLFLTVLFASVMVTYLGWLDDTLGSDEDKGFRGHFRTLFREQRITTGSLKAVGGGITAAISATVTASGGLEWVIHTLFIALMINGLNLLDLRPGRCLKFYLAAAAVLFLWTLGTADALIFIPLLGLAAAVFPYDLEGGLMLGDSGANLLGVQLALWTVSIAPLWLVSLFTLLLLWGHYYGEVFSFTRLIEENRWLSYLDRLWRPTPKR
ncbi:hypothetical protein [Paludifilum halophilum]|uniref:UDP-N-acetylmuramyl pentapeptide phosphotransferase n=1 Tax=Paludifilum halophilum TaxID=1642702 RepID=A0A235BC04_9BACL|nr:hypothetical protein [Paludifilum halophilum]OYD09816.1 hypothetical protein CHM34_02150 [Paludifilum halophilum]